MEVMPIPCPHFKITIVKRSQGQSAVAGAAYQSGERLFSEYDQKTKFYNKKKELVHAEIMLPSHAPPGFADRATLWNAVEAVENQWNSQLARRIVLTFPVEVPKEQYLSMIKEFCQEQFVSKGMIADFAIHDKGDGNPHAHILLTLRAIDEHGKWLPKARKVYDLDENGERIRLASGNWKCHKENTVDWNDQKYAEVWRHGWETITNRYLEAAGRPERVDLRSFERQGIQQIPTVHLGPAAHQMEKRGIETFLGNLNRDIRAANSLMQSIRSAIRGLQRWIADLTEKKQILLDALEKAKEPTLSDLLVDYFNLRNEQRSDWSGKAKLKCTVRDFEEVKRAVDYLKAHSLNTAEDLDTAIRRLCLLFCTPAALFSSPQMCYNSLSIRKRGTRMARNRQNLNIIYISDRMRETLRPIASCALTAVVAPMGYGKTTAVRWFLAEQAKAGAVVLQASIYSDNRSIFWKSVQKAFTAAGLTVLEGYDCPADASGAALLLEDLCAALGGKTPYYLFLDDFHLLGDERVAQFLCRLAYRLPENVHLIVVSRNRFLPGEQVVRLGRRLHRIEADGLRLNREELLAYTHRCGVEITAAQAESLLRSCEGWFSAVYLNLHALAERGSLLQPGSDIYAMFTAAMLESLPEKTRGFLAVMGLADEFTVEMARAVTALPDAEEVLRALTQQNAFVTRLPDGVSFRFHHMMKECAERLFAQLPAARQTEVWQRYGRWYAQKAQYLHALQAFEHCGDRDAALAVIEADAGDLLASLSPAELLQRLDRCPVEALQRHPLAILVLMRRMFTWQQIPKMMELKALLEAAVAQHPEWPAAERGNLLGECDLIQSFLFYNDITQMSRLHRSASRQMSRPAVTLRNSGSWTFGSPSVLMMYYRAPGELGKELAEMYECMPHYYKITNGHGRGAELLMDAEAAYLQGAWEKAAVLLERARVDATGQENMTLCCDFLALRLALCGKGKEGYDFAAKRAALLQKHDGVQVHLLESIAAYFYALQGRPEQAPELFREHKLAEVSFFGPCRPMMSLIEQQIWLAQGEYVKVIAHSEGLLRRCEAMHYGLVGLQARIQLAAAQLHFGQRAEARAALAAALLDAVQDDFWVLFVEQYPALAPLLEGEDWAVCEPRLGPFVARILPAGRAFAARLGLPAPAPAPELPLTDRDRELARLVAGRCTNKEIAAALYLSEGTVKQYINQLYAKLDMGGDPRTRRARLAEWYQKNAPRN